MKRKYLGNVAMTNSPLDVGDIERSDGVITETNKTAPPIHEMIEPTWTTSSATNTTSTIDPQLVVLDLGLSLFMIDHATLNRIPTTQFLHDNQSARSEASDDSRRRTN